VVTREEFLTLVRIVESYVFRRAVCDIPTNSLRQTFATFLRQVDKDRYLESAKARFLLLPSYRRFPGDEEFIRQIQIRNLYKFNRRSYWLRRFENHGRKERVPVQDYTIEHILPQNEDLNSSWQKDLGEDWRRVQDQYLHTLGNLTLTGYNSEYSDRAFNEKRDMEGGFKDSPLKLNQGIGTRLIWNEQAITERAMSLATIASKIWSTVNLEAEILEIYKPKPKDGAMYSIADHPHLSGGTTRALFDKFRIQVTTLDECVSEEFLKLYVAYKAETNFVDVVPQANGLRLSLSLNFPDVEDPKGLCKDVTNLGHWGNGNVEFILKSEDQLQYATSLVNQALEKQLGDDG